MLEKIQLLKKWVSNGEVIPKFRNRSEDDLTTLVNQLEIEAKNLTQADVMPSGFTLKQENAIWSIIQYLSKEQFKNPRRVYKRKDVFDLIKAEMDW